MGDKYRMNPEIFERYRQDVHFRSIVQKLLHFMTSVDIQPYEVRDAAFVAETIYREQHIKPIAHHYQPIKGNGGKIE